MIEHLLRFGTGLAIILAPFAIIAGAVGIFALILMGWLKFESLIDRLQQTSWFEPVATSGFVLGTLAMIYFLGTAIRGGM